MIVHCNEILKSFEQLKFVKFKFQLFKLKTQYDGKNVDFQNEIELVRAD